MLAHQLDDQRMTAQIPHLVEMFHFKAQDPLKTGLCDAQDPAVLQMLAKEHAECGRLQGSLSGLGSEIGQRQRGVRAQIEPALSAAALCCGL